MSSGRAAALAGLRDAAWAHPEWWVVALGLGAWAVMIRHGVAHFGHVHHRAAGMGEEVAQFALMVAAMMLPSLILHARAVAFRSFAERRHRAIALFLGGYFAPWCAFGALAGWLAAQPWVRAEIAIACAFGLAALWALAPQRDRAMQRAHAYVPLLAPSGWEADRDCVVAGLEASAICLASCWASMLACALSGHHLLAMLAGAGISAAESTSFRPLRPVLIALPFAAFAGYFAIV